MTNENLGLVLLLFGSIYEQFIFWKRLPLLSAFVVINSAVQYRSNLVVSFILAALFHAVGRGSTYVLLLQL